jgi:hypothetical protein
VHSKERSWTLVCSWCVLGVFLVCSCCVLVVLYSFLSSVRRFRPVCGDCVREFVVAITSQQRVGVGVTVFLYLCLYHSTYAFSTTKRPARKH